MYLLDKKQRVRRWLKDNDFIEAEMTEEINAANQINFSTPLKDRIADNIYYVAIPTPRSKQKYLLFKLLSERVQNDRIEYQGIEEAYDELKQYGYIKDIRPNDRTAEEMLKMVLEPTRWTLGNVTETSHQSTNLYYITYLEALQKIVGLFNIELTFEVTIDPKSNKITRRQVNIYTEQGQRTGKRFEYGSNLLTVQQEQDSQELITALVGRGKGELVSEGHDDTPDGYGRRITFADVVWTKKDGNPVDKPAGQEYLIDPEATALYGFSDGNPRIGLTVFEDIEDPVELINATWRALQSLKRPKVSFKADVTDVGQLGLGDTVAIIRHDLKIEYLTRVYKVKHNLLNENDNQIELGDDFSGHSITSSLIKVDEIANEARETAGYAAIAANGKNNNYYSSVQPLAPVEGDIWYKDLGNGETDMYQYHNGGWVFIQSTRDLHVVENQVKEAQQGLNQAKADIINNKQKADADIENLNKSIEDNKRTADESLQKLNDSVANLQGQYDNNIVPDLNKAATDAADALQKYIEAQKSITDLTKQAQQQGKDLADVTSTVNGLNINYASLAGDVNSTKVDVKGLQTTIGTANGDIAQLKLDAQNLQTMLAGKVDNTTYTNFVNLTNQALNARLTASDLNGYAKTVDVQATANGLRVDLNSVTQDIQNDLSQLSARIATTSQQFSSYYTKSETDNKTNSAKNDAVNAIKSDSNWTGLKNVLTNSGFLQTADGFLQKVQQTTIPMFSGGGVNLQIGTGDCSFDIGVNRNVTIAIENYDDHTKMIHTQNGGFYTSYSDKSFVPIPGETYTISADVRGDGVLSGGVFKYEGGDNGNLGTTYVTDTWQRVSSTVHVNEVGGQWIIYPVNSTDFYVKHLKIERGSVATPWTPNPSDLATQSAFSELSQSLEGLRSTVGSNYGSLQSQISQSSSSIRTELTDKIKGIDNKTTSTANSLNSVIGRVGSLENLTNFQVINNAINANDYTKTGNYFIQSTSNTNVPATNWCYLKVEKVNDGRIVQTWQADSDPTLRYVRTKFGDSWTQWQRSASYSEYSELNRTVQGLQSTVSSNHSDLQSQISQTAKTIRQEVSDKTSGLQTQINQQANSFNVSLNALRNETAWQKVTTAIDANNYTTTGNYWIQAVSNSNTPDGSAWAYLEVVAEPAVERIKQTWQQDNNANEAYTRLKTGNTWSDWQKAVTAGNIMAQINMSAGTTLIQNNKIYMDADSTIFSGKAFIPSAAITDLSADKITTGTLNAGLINVINLNASSITTGTINGANLKIDLNNGEVQFKRGRITSIANTLNINIDTGTMSVTDGVNNGVYFANGELKLMDDPLNITGTPKYGGLRRSAHIWSPGSAGAELHSPNGVFVGSDNYNGAFAGGSGIDGTSSGAALAVDKDGSATLNGANIVSVSGGRAYDIGYSMKNRPAIILGKSQSGWNPGDRTFIQGAFVHIESAYRNTNGASPNVYVAPDGALVRSTSASKYKTDIQRSYVSDYGERLLELPTATWMDKAETERYVDGESQDKPVRHFGMIAEDLADAGLEMLVSRGQDGELEGIQYDRIGPALIPVIKQLQDKVNKLEEKLNER
ncbi:phage tail spike protein [Limosilactobacillus fermentum]|uniref:phage tail spike protein n=1 Tax=Limosilactobacillus fermentum TaxID=1613 RepID=UPI0021A9F14D|nr:phage tail spike protein [Limosilactobacillus fermentum]